MELIGRQPAGAGMGPSKTHSFTVTLAIPATSNRRKRKAKAPRVKRASAQNPPKRPTQKRTARPKTKRKESGKQGVSTTGPGIRHRNGRSTAAATPFSGPPWQRNWDSAWAATEFPSRAKPDVKDAPSSTGNTAGAPENPAAARTAATYRRPAGRCARSAQKEAASTDEGLRRARGRRGIQARTRPECLDFSQRKQGSGWGAAGELVRRLLVPAG